jgi:hypothetical protein
MAVVHSMTCRLVNFHKKVFDQVCPAHKKQKPHYDTKGYFFWCRPQMVISFGENLQVHMLQNIV